MDTYRGTSLYQLWRRLIFPPIAARLHVEGLEHIPTDGGYLIAPNHVDFLDGFFIGAAIDQAFSVPTHYLTKTNNYWWTTVAIPIPVGDKAAVIDIAAQRLRQGRVICTFPEGARNFGDTLGVGKLGTVKMAQRSGRPIIPAGIACRPGRNMAESIRLLLTSPESVQITFGQPLHIGPQADPVVATRQLMSTIGGLAGKQVHPDQS